MNRDGRLKAGRIHRGMGRRKQHVYALFPAHGRISFQLPRVARKIFVRTELRGIDKDADDDRIAAYSRGADERAMTLVQSSHRRDEPDAHAFSMPRAAIGPHARWGTDNSHYTAGGEVPHPGRDP
jgi:hypothetical protein